jgi:hypothetical protein
MMRAIGWLCLAGMLAWAAGAGRAQTVAPPPDPLHDFLRDLADSTDVYFGPTAVAFDTTGLDSLRRSGGEVKSGRPGRTSHVSASPYLNFHRATGLAPGATLRRRAASFGEVEVFGSYGVANKEGRYRFVYERDIKRGDSVLGEEPSRFYLRAAYARETVEFAAEHAEPIPSAIGAFFTGRDRQSVFERRGMELGLRLRGRVWNAGADYRDALDQSMPRATNFTLWGRDATVPDVTPASEGNHQEGAAFLVYHRSGELLHAGTWGTYSSRERWRVRVAGAGNVVVGPRLEAHVQAEAGLAAPDGPSQDRFELGGSRAVPSLGYGDQSGAQLLLGKLEVISGVDLLKAVKVPHPSYLVFHPVLFAHGGAVWSSETGAGAWSEPPRQAWRGSAGIALFHLPGIPSPSTYVRLQLAWPVGLNSGVARFSVCLGQWFDLVAVP